MKKIVLLILSMLVIVSLSACGDDNTGGGGLFSGNDEETVTANVDVTDEEGKFSVKEDDIKQLLSQYPDDVLGLSADVFDFTF